MGEYRVLVQIDDDDPAAAPPPPGAATMASLTVHNVVPLRASASQRLAARDEDLGHSLDIESLIPGGNTGRIATSAAAAAAAAGSLREPAEPAPAPGDAEFTTTATPPGPMQDRVNRLRAAARARLEGTSPALSVQNGMQAFCRGAGIDGERIPVTNDAQALQLAGRLLREALLGLKEILRAQGAFDNRYGISHEPPEGPSPLELAFDEYLLELLGGHEQRRLDAVLRLRDQFASAARHAGAIDPALRSALPRFVGHLDPARMNGLPAETSWARFRDIYANLLRANGGEVPPLFVEALAQAWLEARNGQR
jgi:predicted component of type VI protein secretion system